MNWFRKEYGLFKSCSLDMRILLLTNMVYALVLPVIEIFVAAYVMRNSREVSKVVIYQLAIYAATPLAFLINGYLLGRMSVYRLYSLGMLLSGASMLVMMSSNVITPLDIAGSGLMMGISTGFFWANRGFLTLSTTTNENRNYYYGLEQFVYTGTSVGVPVAIGWFIEGTARRGWFGGEINHAYRLVAFGVCGLTIIASLIVHRGNFPNPPRTRFIYLTFHRLWYKLLSLSVLKGLAQGYFVTAPAMLIMKLVGQEGALGTIQAAGGVVSAIVLYAVGRTAKPKHRLLVFTVGLVLFTIGTFINALLFSAIGVLIFMACLLLAKPLLDIAYFPIQMLIIDIVSRIEGRNQYAYIFNCEFALFLGRLTGCGLFIALAYSVSDIAALKYALPVIAVVQLLSIWVTRSALSQVHEINVKLPQPLDPFLIQGVAP
jgi:MFS transporter, YQGE family, putative transporter